MNLYSNSSPESMRIAPPPRTGWILLIAFVQGVACWCLPKNLLFAVLPPLITAPVAFYVSERYLTKRPWLPSLLISLCWLPELCYLYFVVGGVESGSNAFTANVAVYWAFCFFSLPFIQTVAELGFRGLCAAELSARMNRNITLGLLGCLALMPVCLALGFGIGNIDWDAWKNVGWGEAWNRSTPYFIFSLVVPITFAGAVNWAQISMERQAGTGLEWPVLPFLRKTLGVISGWVALVAGIAMAGILLSFFVFGGDISGNESFLRLMPAAFFWTACSMSVREGRWEEKSRFFRAVLTACTLVFPLYMLWCAFVQWDSSGTGISFYSHRHAFWTWQNLSLGILLLASLGHGMAVCRRRWPEWASAVNVGVHLCILLLLIVTRLPIADPLRYEAEAKAAWLVANPQESSEYAYERLERDFGRYGPEALSRILAEQGAELGALPTTEPGTEKNRRDAAWEALLARSKTQAYDSRLADLRATFADVPRLPKDAVVPESFLHWLAASGPYYYNDWLKPRKGQYFLLQDMNRDGEPEIILLDLRWGNGKVLKRDEEKGWQQVTSLDFEENTEPPLTIATERPFWDDLVINGKRINVK